MKEKKHTVTVQFSPSDVKKLKKVAGEEDKSVAAVIRTAVKKQYPNGQTISKK